MSNPKFRNIDTLIKKNVLSGDEKIPVSSESFVTPRQIAAFATPQFVITTDESFALEQRDGRVYIVIPK